MFNGHIANFAKRRDVEIQVIEAGEIGNEYPELWFYAADNDSEPEMMYIQNDDGTLSFKGKLNKSLEDLPAWIDSKDKLKKVICYLSDMLAAEAM